MLKREDATDRINWTVGLFDIPKVSIILLPLLMELKCGLAGILTTKNGRGGGQRRKLSGVLRTTLLFLRKVEMEKHLSILRNTKKLIISAGKW